MSSRIVGWSPADGPVDAVAQRLRNEHPGEVIDVRDPGLVDALAAAGAALGRRSLVMALAPLPDSMDEGRWSESVGPLIADPARHADALVRAFPPEHPDHDPAIADRAGAVRALESYFAGAVIGPHLADASSEAVDGDGRVVGGLVINRMPDHDESPGGPWVTDVFVEPEVQGRGVGRALFARAVSALRAAGEPTLRLAVHVDNPAQRLYADLGFQVSSAWCRITL